MIVIIDTIGACGAYEPWAAYNQECVFTTVSRVGLSHRFAAALDALVRLRLRKVGEQSRPFQGGLFNHAKYLRLRTQHHWSG